VYEHAIMKVEEVRESKDADHPEARLKKTRTPEGGGTGKKRPRVKGSADRKRGKGQRPSPAPGKRSVPSNREWGSRRPIEPIKGRFCLFE
jgi:hypothetical protein